MLVEDGVQVEAHSSHLSEATISFLTVLDYSKLCINPRLWHCELSQNQLMSVF